MSRFWARAGMHLERTSVSAYLAFHLHRRWARCEDWVREHWARFEPQLPEQSDFAPWGEPLFTHMDLSGLDKQGIVAHANEFLERKLRILGVSAEASWHLTDATGIMGRYSPQDQQRALAIRARQSPEFRSWNWWCDVKSGYEFDPHVWFSRVRFSPRLGVDIKIPWELGRCQHLPHLAIAYGLTRDEKYAREIVDTILDFISLNRVGFGVQWVSPMDVSIRAANWIVAWDLLLAFGFQVSRDISNLVGASLIQHGEFVETHREWHPYVRTNHYLSNLTGLLTIARRMQWSRFDSYELTELFQEFWREVDYQFHADGSNIEGSTCYHHLSMEMVLFGLALGIKYGTFPENLQKVCQMEEFAEAVVRSNSGAIIQVGDNDGGRWLKMPWSEGPALLNYSDVRSGWRALFTHDRSTIYARLLGEIAGERRVVRLPILSPAVKVNSASQGTPRSQRAYTFKWSKPIELQQLQLKAFPNFGLYIVRSDEFFLSLRCGGHHLKGLGGHFHNDQLSVDLTVHGQDFLRDPGTFTYLANLKERDQYRSIWAHFSPHLKNEPVSMERGPFCLIDTHVYELVRFEKGHLKAQSYAYGPALEREIRIEATQVLIVDSFWGEGELIDLTTRPQITPTWTYGVFAQRP